MQQEESALEINKRGLCGKIAFAFRIVTQYDFFLWFPLQWREKHLVSIKFTWCNGFNCQKVLCMIFLIIILVIRFLKKINCVNICVFRKNEQKPMQCSVYERIGSSSWMQKNVLYVIKSTTLCTEVSVMHASCRNKEKWLLVALLPGISSYVSKHNGLFSYVVVPTSYVTFPNQHCDSLYQPK